MTSMTADARAVYPILLKAKAISIPVNIPVSAPLGSVDPRPPRVAVDLYRRTDTDLLRLVCRDLSAADPADPC